MPTLSTIYTAKPAAQDVKAVTLTHTTAAIANQASEDYNFVISNMSQLLEVSCDVDCRVILYGSSAGRAADTRVYNDYNNDNSIVNSTNLLFDVVLTAGTQNVNNVFLTNREGSNHSTIYAKIFNLSGASSAVQVGLKVVQFGFENDFNLITTQTADCTANDGESIPCDTSGGAFTVTTPASGRFKVIDVAGNASTEGFGVNNLTIEAAAGTTIMGDAVLNLDVGAISPEFQLIGTDWRITNSNYGGVVDSAPPVVTREVLTADRTYYVRTDGDDNNDGLSDTAGGAFATAIAARDTLRTIDGNGKKVTIKFADGTYTTSTNVEWSGFVGISTLFLEGNTTNPENVVIQAAVGVSIVTGVWILSGGSFELSGFKFTNTQPNADCLTIQNWAKVIIRNNRWGTATRHHINVFGFSVVDQIGNCSIDGGTGGAGRFVTASASIVSFNNAGVCTITNSPAYVDFVAASSGGVINWVSSIFSWSGSATGRRYFASANGIIQTYGQGVNFPGSQAGTLSTGGQYL